MAKQATLTSRSAVKAVLETGIGDPIARRVRNARAAIGANERIESDVTFMKQDISSLVVLLLAVFMTAFIGSWFAPGAWYAALNKPNWTPPNWLFAPVWSILYIAIAGAGWLVWREPTARRSELLTLWGAQLVLNGAWSWLFFGLQAPALALLDIVALLCAIIAFVAIGITRNRVAAWLFLPYGLWVGFATALNFSIWRMNPL